jgi:oligopeptide/dipeptide ABC transporter ATP-binding protein
MTTANSWTAEAGPAPSPAPLLAIEDLRVTLPTRTGPLCLVDGVSFEIGAGELVGLAGESGSGKTMSALAIMRLLPFRRVDVTGSARFEGRELLEMSRREVQALRGSEISFVFQEPMTSLHPAFTIGDQIGAVLRAHRPVSKAQARERAVEMLELVGLNEPARRAKQYPHELSGGMQQRVMIALALVCKPKLLIADEPTTALDVTVQAQIVELIRSLQQELGMAVLFVTHDLGLLAELCDRMLVMYAGQLVEDADMAATLVRPRHPYTKALLEAAPHPRQRGQRLPAIAGGPPPPGSFPEGCRFHPRCPHGTDACSAAGVPIEPVVGGTGRARCLRVDELDLSAEGARP